MRRIMTKAEWGIALCLLSIIGRCTGAELTNALVGWGRWDSGVGVTRPAMNVASLSAMDCTISVLYQDGRAVNWDGCADVEGKWSRDQVYWWPGTNGFVLTNIVANRASWLSGLALRGDGRAFSYPLLPNGAFLRAPEALTNVLAIDVRGSDCVGLLADGQLISWGPRSASLPPKVPGGITVLLGDNSLVVLRADGTIFAWDMVARKPVVVPQEKSGVTS
jgi:hypothetical protein